MTAYTSKGPFVKSEGDSPESFAIVRSLVTESYDPYIHLTQTQFEYVSTALALITETDRSEVYFFVGDELAGAVMYSAVFDIHYGRCAVPVGQFIREKFRGDRELLRHVVECTRAVVADLGCDKYYDVKHTAPGVQVHRLRTL